MKLERLETLLWERIDGVITADDEAELESFLAGDEEGRELEQELTALAKRLAGVRKAVPPPVLRHRIDEALASARELGTDERAVRSAVRLRSPNRWAPRLFAMAASLLVGVGIGYLLSEEGGRPVDESWAAGAIYAPAADQVPAVLQMVLGEGAGTLEARRIGNKVSVQLTLVGEHEAELRLEAEDGDLQIAGIHSEAGGPGEVFADEGLVVVRTAGAGSTGVELLCSDRTASVHLVVTMNSETVAERWITSAGGEGGP